MKHHPWLALRPWKRHSLVVGIGGAVYLVYGAFFAAMPVNAQRRASLELALWAPAELWGFIWIFVGGLALASTRWPPASETWGYTLMSSLSVLWASFYAGGMFLGAPVTNVGGVLVWALLGVLWWGIAGLRNPDDMPKG